MFSSSGHGKKPPSQQEMVQVDRAEYVPPSLGLFVASFEANRGSSASPFWRAPPREPAGKKGGSKSSSSGGVGNSSNSNSNNSSSNSNNMRDPTKVVGAAYSHADLLKFDSLSLAGSPSRPRSPPPAATSHKTKTHSSSGSGSGSKAPPFRNYKSFLSNTDEDWNADEEEDVYGYDEDDGDDFGLPSLSNMKRRTRRMAAAAAAAQSGSGSGSGRLRSSGDGDVGWGAVEELDGFGSSQTTSTAQQQQQQQQRPRRYSNSADIAVERPAPSYPVPKKSEGKILRPQYKDILRDPANALHLISHAAVPAGASAKEAEAVSARISRINKFKKLLQASTIPLPELRALAWSGIPHEVRAMTWQLLLSYLPTSSERRVATLERKRREYLDGVRQAFDGVGGGSDSKKDGDGEMGDRAGANRTGANRAGANRANAKGRGLDEAVWHQISIDVPRTNPHMELYGFEATQRSLERILYVWAVRHPASGYVQGINDLVTPFWQVFLGVYISDPDIESGMDPGQLPRAVLDAVEADSFWCLTKLLDGIQDHYIVAQPGIQRQVAALRDLTARIDSPLARHLEDEHVEFIQFSFRWMNCLLMREISVKNTIRMWDTYMAEENGFSEFHLYVCAAFLVKWSAKLCGMDFQEIMMFLQSLPTREWTEKDIELLLSEAYIWQSLFKGSSAHLRGPASRAPSTNLQL